MNIDSRLDTYIRESLKRHMNGEYVDCGDRQISDYLYDNLQIWILTRDGTTSIIISGKIDELNKLCLKPEETAAS